MLFKKKFRIRVKGNLKNLDKFSDAARKAIKENRGWFGYVLRYVDSEEACKLLHDMVCDEATNTFKIHSVSEDFNDPYYPTAIEYEIVYSEKQNMGAYIKRIADIFGVNCEIQEYKRKNRFSFI